MLLPASRILRSLVNEVRQLGDAQASGAVASSEQSVNLALNLLLTRESAGPAAVLQQLERLAATLFLLKDELAALDGQSGALAKLRETITSALQTADLQLLEPAWRNCLQQLEVLIADAVNGPSLPESARLRLASVLVAAEAGDLQGQISSHAVENTADHTIDATRLQAYLQHRFNEQGLAVQVFRPLPGGFGKQTYLFEVQGQALSGGFVLRRDQMEPFIDNDCHRIHHEYAVIRAVHACGFPAPEALWCDTGHHLLPGGDFLVMRRASGVAGGSVFAAQGAVPADLTATLAGILARLHALPPQEALGSLTNSINTEFAQLSVRDCTRRYIADWLALYRRTEHLPSPAILSQFAWLLAHVPNAGGQPVLLHGDMGFHNFLFEQRDGAHHLSAVLDWEFAHLGDPAEDLAYVRNTLGVTLDWPAFLAAYQAAGGSAIDDTRIRFFEVWGHVRNAASSSMAAGFFAQDRISDLKMVLLPHLYIPMFLRAAQAAIERATT